MLPELNLKDISSIAEVVLKYPEGKSSLSKLPDEVPLNLPKKCFTKVVLDGLNKVKEPLQP